MDNSGMFCHMNRKKPTINNILPIVQNFCTTLPLQPCLQRFSNPPTPAWRGARQRRLPPGSPIFERPCGSKLHCVWLFRRCRSKKLVELDCIRLEVGDFLCLPVKRPLERDCVISCPFISSHSRRTSNSNIRRRLQHAKQHRK